MDITETVVSLGLPVQSSGSMTVRVARIDLTVYSLDIDYAAGEAGTAHFAVWLQGIHTANAALGAVSVTADGRIAPALNEVAAKIGLREGAEDTARLFNCLRNLAALFGTAHALIEPRVFLEPGAFRHLREIAQHHRIDNPAPTRTAPFCHHPTEARA